MTIRRILTLALTILLAAVTLFAQKQSPPEGSKPKDFKLPPKKTFTLNNGLRVSMVQYGIVPKVSINVTVRAGNLNEGKDQVWLADLTTALMKEGTTTRTAQDVSRQAAMMGGSVNIGVTADQTTFSGDVLSESASDFIQLLADVVRNPRFPESELSRLKNDKLRELSLAKADPQSMTNELFRKLMYGDHPYGRVYPTEEMLKSYTLDQVRSFYDANYGAARARIYIVGRFNEKRVRDAIQKAFNDWKKGSAIFVNVPKPTSKREIHIIDRPGAAQSTVYIGIPVIDPSNKNYIPLRVTDALLGGSFASRITSNIREDKGYTYSPFSQLSVRYRDAYWIQQADVTTDVTGPSLKEIFYEINRLQLTPPSTDELKGIQNYLAGTFVLRNSSPGGIIGQLSTLDLHGLPDSYLRTYVKSIYTVTPEQVQQLTKTYLRADDMLIVIAGDRKKIEEQVSAYGKIVD
jgi:zinc protease